MSNVARYPSMVTEGEVSVNGYGAEAAVIAPLRCKNVERAGDTKSAIEPVR
jgi:hypothetical protein